MIEPGKHKLTEALEGQVPPSADDAGGQPGPSQPTGPGSTPREGGRPESTPREVAELKRREQQAKNPGTSDQDRDDRLVQVGRGHQTHG